MYNIADKMITGCKFDFAIFAILTLQIPIACFDMCLPDAKLNLIMAKATGLIFSLFDVASAQEVPFGIPQYVLCILHGLTSVLLCVPFIFADSQKSVN